MTKRAESGTPDDAFEHREEWLEVAQQISASELRRLVSFYDRGIRSGLSPASPWHVLAVMRDQRRRVRLMVSQIERSVLPPTEEPADPSHRLN